MNALVNPVRLLISATVDPVASIYDRSVFDAFVEVVCVFMVLIKTRAFNFVKKIYI